MGGSFLNAFFFFFTCTLFELLSPPDLALEGEGEEDKPLPCER